MGGGLDKFSACAGSAGNAGNAGIARAESRGPRVEDRTEGPDSEVKEAGGEGV